MKEQREAWWAEVNWDHLDALTACEAWDAAERVHAAALAGKDAEIASRERECAVRNERELGYLSRAQNAEARASRAEAEAAGLRADAERWRTVSAMMTHEHRGDAVGWTLSVLLPGDDPDVAADAAIAARVGDEP